VADEETKIQTCCTEFGIVGMEAELGSDYKRSSSFTADGILRPTSFRQDERVFR
jgi:hypothetical protein